MRKIKFIVSFVALSVLFYFVLQTVAFNSYNFLSVNLQQQDAGAITFFTKNNGQQQFSQYGKSQAEYAASNDFKDVNLVLQNSVTQYLRIALNTNQQTVSIRNIKLNGFFQTNELSWSAKQIIEQFDISAPHQWDETTHSIIVSPSADEFTITLKNKLSPGYPLQWLIGSAVLALLLMLVISQLKFSSLPALYDFNNNNNMGVLDGVRGFAALLVLLEHTMYRVHGVGHAGVWLFFVLSGFLLSKPFALTPSKAIDLVFVKKYLFRRMKRIVPAFYFIVFIVYFLNSYTLTGLRHLLFMQGDMHLWTILHEIYFYVLLPFIALLVFFVCRNNTIASIALLSLIAFCWHIVPESSAFGINGYSVWQKPWFEVFILGMVGGYTYFALIKDKAQNFQNQALSIKHYVVDVLVLGLFSLFLIATCNLSLLSGISVYFLHLDEPFVQAVICMVVIVYAAICHRQGVFNKLFCLSLLRYIGLIGYSFYLIHPYIIKGVTDVYMRYFIDQGQPLSGLILSSVSFVLTMIFASIMYSYIERPFLGKGPVLDKNSQPTTN